MRAHGEALAGVGLSGRASAREGQGRLRRPAARVLRPSFARGEAVAGVEFVGPASAGEEQSRLYRPGIGTTLWPL